MSVTGVVLAAGSSRRLGTPKQVLPYRDTTLLGATLEVARRAGFDQLIVTVGGAAEVVRHTVPLDGADVVSVDDAGTGCSASLRVAVQRVDPRAAGIVLMLLAWIEYHRRRRRKRKTSKNARYVVLAHPHV